jgi:hypothetical protein
MVTGSKVTKYITYNVVSSTLCKWQVKFVFCIYIQQSPLGQTKSDRIRQMTTFLRLIDLNLQFQYAMIHIFLLPEGISLEKMVVAL